MVTTIGIDPHKATHTAVAIDGSEVVLSEITIAADRSQTEKLVGWANELDGDGRLWAVEAAGGLGYLLSRLPPAIRAQASAAESSPTLVDAKRRVRIDGVATPRVYLKMQVRIAAPGVTRVPYVTDDGSSLDPVGRPEAVHVASEVDVACVVGQMELVAS